MPWARCHPSYNLCAEGRPPVSHLVRISPAAYPAGDPPLSSIQPSGADNQSLTYWPAFLLPLMPAGLMSSFHCTVPVLFRNRTCGIIRLWRAALRHCIPVVPGILRRYCGAVLIIGFRSLSPNRYFFPFNTPDTAAMITIHMDYRNNTAHTFSPLLFRKCV